MNYFYPIKPELLPQAVERVNELRKWYNKVVPQISNALAGCRIIANGHDIGKRERTVVNQILATKTGIIRAYLSVSPQSVWLCADTNINLDNGYSTSYGESRYVGPESRPPFEPLPMLTVEQVKADLDEYLEAKNDFYAAEYRLRKLQGKIQPFGRG